MLNNRLRISYLTMLIRMIVVSKTVILRVFFSFCFQFDSIYFIQSLLCAKVRIVTIWLSMI